MKGPGIGMGVVVGALLAAPLLGVMYLASKLTGLPFVPYDLFDGMTRELPGSVVTFGIDLMIDTMRLVGLSVAETAKTAERAMAVLQFFFGGMAAGGLYFWVIGRSGRRPALLVGAGIGALVGVTMAAVSIGIGGATVHPAFVVLWLAAVFMVWCGALSEAYVRLSPRGMEAAPLVGPGRPPRTITRRQFVVGVGAAAATITVASTGLGTLLSHAARRELEAELQASGGDQSRGGDRTPFPNANDPVIPAPGTRPEYTPLRYHYKVSIRTSPTVIDGATWSLPISGLVANPVSLTISDLRDNFEPRSQFVTLSCISGRIGTDLIGTTEWTGVSVQDILADVQPSEEARYLYITSADGFHETVDLDLIRSDDRVMLCYAWNGMPLSMDHGFPLRIWIPDRYGMKQPRWIESIEVMKDYKRGYWVSRGWDEVARIEATSVIDTVAADSLYESGGRTFVPVGGIAFAGDRGVSRVEVRVNGGPWQEARVRRGLSETTWVIWRYDWPFSPGEYVFDVRCAEGDGTPQTEADRGSHPAGATGVHSERVKI